MIFRNHKRQRLFLCGFGNEAVDKMSSKSKKQRTKSEGQNFASQNSALFSFYRIMPS